MTRTRKTFTATFPGATPATITTSRKIAWASFLLFNGTWVLGDFYAGSRAHAERDARSTVAINRNRGWTDFRIVTVEEVVA